MVITEAWEGLRRDGRAVDRVIAALAAKVGNRLVTSQAVREQHGNTLTWIANQPPDAVVFPQSTEEVQEIVRLCADERVPVIGFGTGTSLEGQINAPLGGMAATRASGTNAVRYGTMKDNVISLKVVLASGEVMTTATRAKKSSSGYDLTRLIVGSEGTLGIITELTLRLAGIPETIAAGTCPFPSVEAACNATITTIQTGIPVARIELLDALQVHACNLHSKLSLPETPTLFLEFHGTKTGVAEQSRLFGEIAKDLGGGPFDWATMAEDRSRLWQARHDSYWAQRGLRPGAEALASDVCVPISRLAECLNETQRDIADNNLLAPIVGHVGDGNFHVGLLVDPKDPEEVARVEDFLERLVERALRMGGTCTGEHGVGQGKMKYLAAEHGAPALDAMRAIKRALDPLDIMNPGKIFSL